MLRAVEADPRPGKYPGKGGRLLALVLLASLLLTFVPVTAHVALAAGPFTVNTTADPDPATIAGGCSSPGGGSTCSLRLAIIEAPVGEATTITLPAGTYVLTRTNSTTNAGRDDAASLIGDLDIAPGKNITILGAGQDATIIDGNASNVSNAALRDRVFDVLGTSSPGGSLTLGSASDPTRGVTVTNGMTAGSGGSVNPKGGGIRVRGDGLLAIYHSKVTGNTSVTSSNQGNGGGIAVQDTATVIIENSLIGFNIGQVSAQGGGLYAEGTNSVQIRNSQFVGNSSGNGGAVHVQGASSLTVSNSSFIGNSAGNNGGGIYYGASSLGPPSPLLTITGSTFDGNTAGVNGAGLSVAANAPLPAPCPNTVTGSTFSGNKQTGPGFGGGIGVTQACLDVLNSTISGNIAAGGQGGGVHSAGGNTTLTYVTVAENSTGVASAGYTPAFSSTTYTNILTIRNSIIADSTAGANCLIGTLPIGGTILPTGTVNTLDGGNSSTPGYNVDSGTSCGFGFGPDSGNTSNTDSTFGPILLPLAVNTPGTLATHALRPVSTNPAVTTPNPAADRIPASGDLAVKCVPPPGPQTPDERGLPRPQGTGCDSGAYELLPAPTITGIAPASGPTVGGTLIEITGTGFQSGATVTIAGNPCTGLAVSGGTTTSGFTYNATSILCTTPPGTLGAKDVVLDNPDPQPAVTAEGGYTYVATPLPSPGASASPSASPSFPPGTLFTVTSSANAGGTISPAGIVNYAAGGVATYTATADAGSVFLGWTLDGVFVGHASPLDFHVNSDRVLVGRFAQRPAFQDVPTTDADYQAITFLAALGIVNPSGVNGTERFEPGRDVARAEMAAFIARIFGWNTEFHANTFPDKCDQNGQNCIDDELWNTVAALQDYGVVGGYTDGATCASAGTTAPCYLPRDPVKRVQVISIVARAFIKAPDQRPTGFWDRLAADPAQYTNVPNSGTQRSDLTTFRANAGPIPGQASDTTFPDPEGNASRRFVIQALYQAYNAWYGVDRVP